MISFIRQFGFAFLLLSHLLGGDDLLASPMPPITEVASVSHRELLNDRMLWCRADKALTPDDVLAGGCPWKVMSAEDSVATVDKAVFWLRMTLRNDSEVTVTRWLKVGHSRTRERSIHIYDGGTWRASRSGLAVPLATLGEDPATTRGFLPLEVPAGATVDVLIRVESTSWVDLRTRLLQADQAIAQFERVELWVTLAVGGLGLAIAFGLLLLVRTRRWVYLSFAVALSGEMLVELHRTGVLQHLFWPSTQPVPDYIMSIGGVLLLSGWSSFLYMFLPTLRRYQRFVIFVAVLIAVQILAQLWSIFIDFQAGLRVWSYLFVPTQLCGAILCWVGMKGADASGRRLLGLLMVVFLFGMARVLFAQTIDEAGTFVLELAPLMLILGLPLVLFALTESTRELETQLSRVEAQSAGQLRFLAQMSHELRTPLDTVLGNAQLLLRGGAKTSGPVAQDGLRSIIESARHLLGMIDEILSYARGLSSALALRTEPTLLADFIHSIETTGQIFSVRNRDRFVLRQRPGSADISRLVLMIDAARLRQVIDNLLVNAARHTREGLITLEYGAVALDDGRVNLSFCVTDTGEGIAPEDHERVFLPFERAGRNGQSSGKGIGMGLPTARQLVRAMGGDISLKSELGRGASFSFDIVVPTGSASDVVTSVDEGGPVDATGYLGERRTILLVDDENATRRLLAALLTRLGFRVIEVDSGRAATEILRTSLDIDLIITDQFMADGDGWDVLEMAKQTHPEVATVLMSAAPPSPPEGWPLNVGFAASLLKPVDHDVLLRRIGDLLQLQWLRDSSPVRQNEDLLIRPPVPEMQALSRMVDLGEVTAIREWSMQLRRDYPQCTAFADKVEQAVTLLDFKALEAMLGRGAAA